MPYKRCVPYKRCKVSLIALVCEVHCNFCSRVYFVLCVNDCTVIRKAIVFVAFDVLFPVYLFRLALQLKL